MLSFVDHLSLLDRHGQQAARLLADAPAADEVRDAAADSLTTMRIWAWLVEDPSRHASEHVDAAVPEALPALGTELARAVDQVGSTLAAAGPDVHLDYFGVPGTTAEVARLLAHGAITVEHTVARAAGQSAPVLDRATAVDGIDHAMRHWASPDAPVNAAAQPIEIKATDAGQAWYIRPEARSDPMAFRLSEPALAAATIHGTAVDLLWWLHGETQPNVVVSGDPGQVRAALQVFLHPVAEEKSLWRRLFS